jgi:hypothetical protein
VGNPNLNAQFISQLLQILFEQVITGIVTTTTVTQDQNGSGLWIIMPAMVKPPVANTGASEFRRVVTDTDGDVANVSVNIIQSVWDSYSRGQGTKIMVMNSKPLLSIEFARAEEVADHLFFLTSMLMTGLP